MKQDEHEHLQNEGSKESGLCWQLSILRKFASRFLNGRDRKDIATEKTWEYLMKEAR
jgi:hypothetical protein